MSRLGVCTTFSPEGYELYGKQFIASFTEFWPDDVPLWVFVEGADEATLVETANSQVVTWNLNMDQEREQFLAHCENHYPSHPTNYRRQPTKFCHKVFALTTNVGPSYDWWLFIDADVTTNRPVTEEWLARLLDKNADVLFLGRPNGKHSETGFMGFQTKTAAGREFLRAMRWYYTSRQLFGLSQWHDSMVFDAVRENLPHVRCLDIAKANSGHVWPSSLLASVMTHNKGPKRKTETYGDSL